MVVKYTKTFIYDLDIKEYRNGMVQSAQIINNVKN
jgi:hypothetical protein